MSLSLAPQASETDDDTPSASLADQPSALGRASPRQTFAELYREHFLKLVHKLRSIFGPGPPEAEDIAQRAFEKIAQKGDLDSIRGFDAFLWRTAKNVRISELRSSIARRERNENYSDQSPPAYGHLSCPERSFLAAEDIALAARCIDRMPETRRLAFVLIRLQGFSQKEAAIELGISRPAVAKHLARASSDLYQAVKRCR